MFIMFYVGTDIFNIEPKQKNKTNVYYMGIKIIQHKHNNFNQHS